MAAVLLTRPTGHNAGLAALLEARGCRTIERPMLTIEQLELDESGKQIVMNLDRFDDVVFVSSNAARLALAEMEKYWPQWPARLRWFAVGAGTASPLEAVDIPVIYPHGGASEGLLNMAPLAEVTGRKVLIVRGRGGRELLADTLRERGAETTYLEMYERKGVDYGPGFADEMARLGVTCVVITSGESLTQFASLMPADGDAPSLAVPSERVRDMAIALGFAKVAVVEDMSDESIAGCVFDLISGERSE